MATQMMRPARSRWDVYSIGEAWQSVLSHLEETDGEVDEWAESALAELIRATPDAIDQACGAIAMVEGECEEIASEERRLADRRRSRAAQADRLRKLVGEALDKAGHKGIRTSRYTVSRLAGRPRVEIVNEAAVPETFRVPHPDTLDKAAIAAALKAGADVPGATLVTGSPALVIK